jgi:excisionase family DNA binding protein
MNSEGIAAALDAWMGDLAARVADGVARRLQDELASRRSPAPRLLNLAEVATRLAAPSKAAVRKLVQRGRIPSVRVGTRILFRSDQIDAFIPGTRRAQRAGRQAGAPRSRAAGRRLFAAGAAVTRPVGPGR